MARILVAGSINRITKIADCFLACFMQSLGPFFILLAVSLISFVAYIYYTVNMAMMFPGQLTRVQFVEKTLHIAFSIYILLHVFLQYAFAVISGPGRPRDYTAAFHEEQERRSEVYAHENGRDEVEIEMHGIGAASTGTSDSLGAEPLLVDGNAPGPRLIKLCKKCQKPKPERAHHCSICNTCVLKMDHHCPWMANCVGHNNHRYFYLFLFYLTLGCFYYMLTSIPLAYQAYYSDQKVDWPSPVSQPLWMFALLLASAMFLAVGGLCGWHTYLILTGQTTIEYYKNSTESHNSRIRGEIWINEYDLGTWRNFQIFFNIGSKYKWWNVLMPIRVPPVGDGTSFLRCSELLSTNGKGWERTEFRDHLMMV
ncbi:DHHC palmitoyltransferase-domain-containing protein [Cladochytrium replicatum]|nr:DHHC palmitoyltransferase-domain-containing protein [Cladochytrium replicatum]